MKGPYGVFGVTSLWEYGYEVGFRHSKNLIHADKARAFKISSVVLLATATFPVLKDNWEIDSYIHK